MPAEAIHLSALDDTLSSASGRVRSVATGSPAAMRAGVMLVDLPYFNRFHFGMVRYALGLPQAHSPWGDRFHQQAPMALARCLAEEGARLCRTVASAETGRALIALALGYISHAALDTAIHPLVSRLAAERIARRGGGVALQEHQEVEKYQSILFHELRHGRDYMGTPELRDFITIDWTPVSGSSQLARITWRIVAEVLGDAPAPRNVARWGRGYRFYTAVLSGPIGRRVATMEQKARERPALFDAVDFPGRFAAGVQRSRLWADALAGYVEDGRFDDSARAALEREIPEQSLDPPAESARVE